MDYSLTRLMSDALLVLGTGFAVLAAIGIMIWRPKWWLTGIMVYLTVTPAPTIYGLADSKMRLASFGLILGTNSIYLPLLCYVTMVACAAAMFARQPVAPDAHGPRLKVLLLIYATLAAVYVAQIFALQGRAPLSQNWWLAYLYAGYVAVFWQAMLIYLIVFVLRTKADLLNVGKLMVAAIAVLHVFGLVRYFFFGGDPQNAYKHLGFVPIKLTFWDINDSACAVFLFAWATWQLLGESQRPGARRWLYMGMAFVGAASVALTARRTPQMGLFFAMLALLFFLPKGRRGVIVAVLALLIPAVVLITSQRSTARESLTDKILLDAKSSRVPDPRASRFYEWKRAFATIRKEPILGVGPAGSFEVVDDRGLEYHIGNFSFMHSGFGHMFLKSGLVGLSLLVAIFVTYIVQARRAWRTTPRRLRGLYIGSIAGLIAGMPNFVFGTPLTEVRTMLVMGLFMGISLACGMVPSARLRRGPPVEPFERDLSLGRR